MSSRIAFVVAPGFELLDLSGPLCVFTCARQMQGAPYAVRVMSSAGGAVLSSSGMPIETVPPDGVGADDLLIAVGGPDAPVEGRQPATVDLLRSLAPQAQRVGSICTGAFYLAEAGLLDGHRVTTHWRSAPVLQARYPALSVEADRIFINDRRVWTSAGVTAGIDMALALVEADFGPALARSVARELLVYYRRPGGQSQFSTILELEPASPRIRKALAYAREHLQEALSVDQLAAVACIGPRQFSRLFQKETGETPARAIERLRAEVARTGVQDSLAPLDHIAQKAGFGDAERMRRSFVRLFGQTPQALRRTARAAASSRSAPDP